MRLPPLIRPHLYVQPTLDTATWFHQLRWLAVIGQLLTMAVVLFVLNIDLPVKRLLALMGVTAISNAGYAWWLSRLYNRGLQREDRLPLEHLVPALMLSDILVLTAMLYLSAGIANPFALFYFVNIAVAGALITPVWAWGIWGATQIGVMLLLIRSEPIAALSATSLLSANAGAPIWTIPKFGFLVSFATCSGVITYFITILTGELRQRELARKEAEEARLRNRQLESLATLAAGAGHELATPLSTIAVVANELNRSLEKQGISGQIIDDVSLIRSELDRCRQILDRMTSTAGEAAGERLEEVSIHSFVDEVLVGVRQADRVEVTIAESTGCQTSLLPVQAVAQAARNVLQNALDASQADTQVNVLASCSEEGWKIEVQDFGEGMEPEVVDRIGEPFFTTKEPGRGMGLGIYLTQNVIRRLDGRLEFDSQPGQGTTATIYLPFCTPA